MFQERIANADSFRAALVEFGAVLDNISPDDAAARADQISGASIRLAKHFSNEDLEDLNDSLTAIRNRVRRKAKRARWGNIWGTVIGAGLTGFAGLMVKSSVVPSWAPIALICVGVVTVFVSLLSLATSNDWRDEVTKPLEVASTTLNTALGARVPEVGYRQSVPPERAGSTKVRVPSTLAEDQEVEREFLGNQTEKKQ